MTLKLLLADESITVQKVFRKAFSDDSFEVAWVDQRDQMMDAVKKLQPNFVILSESFPGIDLSQDLREISNHTSQPGSVIILGNRGNELDLDKSLQLGAGGFLYKPLDNRLLKKTIDELSTLGFASQKADDPIRKTQPDSTQMVSSLQLPDTRQSGETIDHRARVLYDVFESYFNENMVIITESMTKALAPRIAADISSRVIEHLVITDLPKQIMMMTKGIVNDLVPQIAERVIAREIENIKSEAIRLLEEEDDEYDENV